MIAPPEVAYCAEWRLMLWKPRGILSEQTVTDIVSFIEWQRGYTTRAIAPNLSASARAARIQQGLDEILIEPAHQIVEEV